MGVGQIDHEGLYVSPHEGGSLRVANQDLEGLIPTPTQNKLFALDLHLKYTVGVVHLRTHISEVFSLHTITLLLRIRNIQCTMITDIIILTCI